MREMSSASSLVENFLVKPVTFHSRRGDCSMIPWGLVTGLDQFGHCSITLGLEFPVIH